MSRNFALWFKSWLTKNHRCEVRKYDYQGITHKIHHQAEHLQLFRITFAFRTSIQQPRRGLQGFCFSISVAQIVPSVATKESVKSKDKTHLHIYTYLRNETLILLCRALTTGQTEARNGETIKRKCEDESWDSECTSCNVDDSTGGTPTHCQVGQKHVNTSRSLSFGGKGRNCEYTKPCAARRRYRKPSVRRICLAIVVT